MGRWPAPAIARPAAAPMTSMPSARRGAHQAGSRMRVRRQDRQRARRGRSRVVRPPRSRTARSRPYPHGASRRPGMTGTPASRPPGQRPRHRHPGTAARQAGLPGRLGHASSLPAPGGPGQGALVLQHAPPPPGPQPGSRTPPQTGTMTTRHRARHARCQPRREPGTLMATVTPSTSTPRRRTPWTSSDDATPAPQGHPQRPGTTTCSSSSSTVQYLAPDGNTTTNARNLPAPVRLALGQTTHLSATSTTPTGTSGKTRLRVASTPRHATLPRPPENASSVTSPARSTASCAWPPGNARKLRGRLDPIFGCREPAGLRTIRRPSPAPSLTCWA